MSGLARARSILGAMLTRLDHVGIAVPDIESAVRAYERLLGRAPSHRDVVESDGIDAVMFELGESRVELLGATGPGSRIARFLERRGGGLHHVAYGVDDVQAALDAFAALGLTALDSCPRRGAAGRLVAFLHPSAAAGVLTELCQPDPGPRGLHG